jgi:hypothetical protein
VSLKGFVPHFCKFKNGRDWFIGYETKEVRRFSMILFLFLPFDRNVNELNMT